MTATYYVNDFAIFQKTTAGVRALNDEAGTYEWGEEISEKDFNEDAFETVEFEATDFDNLDPYYQRRMTNEVALAAQELTSNPPPIMPIPRDKNGFRLMAGIPVTIPQEQSIQTEPKKIYHLVDIDSELHICIPLKEFQIPDSDRHSVESVR